MAESSLDKKLDIGVGQGSRFRLENLLRDDQEREVVSEDPNKEQTFELLSDRQEEIEEGHFGVVPGILIMDRGLSSVGIDHYIKAGEGITFRADNMLLVKDSGASFVVDKEGGVVFKDATGASVSKVVFRKPESIPVGIKPYINEKTETVISKSENLPEHKGDWNLVTNGQEWEKTVMREEKEKMLLETKFKLNDKHRALLDTMQFPEIGLLEILSQNAVTAGFKEGTAVVINSVDMDYHVDKQKLPSFESFDQGLDVAFDVQQSKRTLDYILFVKDEEGKLLLTFKVKATLMPQKLLQRAVKLQRNKIRQTLEEQAFEDGAYDVFADMRLCEDGENIMGMLDLACRFMHENRDRVNLLLRSDHLKKAELRDILVREDDRHYFPAPPLVEAVKEIADILGDGIDWRKSPEAFPQRKKHRTRGVEVVNVETCGM